MQSRELQTVLVTGANGFIGSRLCRLLAASGYALRILCRETSNLTLLADIPYSKTIGDITRVESLASAVKDVDYIIHLAGLVKAPTEAEFYRVNQQGTLNLINAVKNTNLKLRRFVYISSLAAAGPSDGAPRKVTDPPAPLTMYGRSKLAGEEALRPFMDLIPISIIRPPGVYGPGDREIFTLFDAVNKGLKPYMAGGHNKVQLVFVDDLATGIMAVMESENARGRTYFIADDTPRTTRDMLDTIGKLLDKRALGVYIPLWLVNLLAFFTEMAFKMVGQVAMFSREKVRELTTDWEIDVSDAKRDLDFATHMDFETGAAATIAWYRREGWLK